MKHFIRYGCVLLALLSCRFEGNKTSEKEKVQVEVPAFQADSAYWFTQRQVDFGPRIPNTIAHRMAGDFLVSQLQRYGASVIEQQFIAEAYDGQNLELRNIIAVFNPQQKKRILLAAHWDTRPFADKDPVNKNAAFDGANDAASAVGVLLEVCRLMLQVPPNVGVDVILFDGEDFGEPEGVDVPLRGDLQSWWCLGSQHWAKTKHQAGYSAYYGILLDMAGAERARFYREGVSQQFAPSIVSKVWNAAERLGYSDYFVNLDAPEVMDDHVFVNTIAKIPMIDIIEHKPEAGSFAGYHHTTSDNMTIISKATLRAVGATVMQIVYEEEPL